MARGEWVAEFPDCAVRGYQVAQLIVPGADLTRLVAASKKSPAFERERFFKDLGLPDEPEGGRLSSRSFRPRSRRDNFTMVDSYTSDGLVTMGVDVASTRNLHVRISEHLSEGTRRGIYISTVSGFDELDELMAHFRVHLAAIDHMPERRLARAFAERHHGRVYLVAYDLTARPRSDDWIRVDEDARFVTVRHLDERRSMK